MSTVKLSQLPSTAARDPVGEIPFSGAVPFQTYTGYLADIVGNYSNFLAGTRALVNAPTAGLTSSNLVNTVVVGSSVDAYPYSLQPGSAAATPPTVLQPFDYNASTNAVNYNLLRWHSLAFVIEGTGGSGFLSLPSQSPAPTATASALLAFSTGTVFSLLSASGAVNIPTSGNTVANFLRGDGIWAPTIPVAIATSSGTLIPNTYTVVRAAGTTIQTLPPAAPSANATCIVKNQGAGTVTVSAGSFPIIFASSPGSVYSCITGASSTFTWDGTYWNVS
jgi:hypothetical protein